MTIISGGLTSRGSAKIPDNHETTHPALWHILDTGAVAQEILQYRPVHDSKEVNEAVAALVALHDLGKVNQSFQNVLKNAPSGGVRHWQLTGWYFCQRQFRSLLDDRIGLEHNDRSDLLRAVITHHGNYREPFAATAAEAPAKKWIFGDSKAIADAETIMCIVLSLFPNADLRPLDCNCDDKEFEGRMRQLSWQVSGLVVQCDWIASNTEFFPMQPAEIPLDEYWQQTKERASAALKKDKAWLFQSSKLNSETCHPLKLVGTGNSPRPMQKAMMDIKLSRDPMLVFLEDTTGSGKTEAALILARRMIDEDKGKGIFIGMPTMATSDAIYERMKTAKLLLLSGEPSMKLTHSRANSIINRNPEYTDTDKKIEITGSDWLADDRRRVLFADLAVGTIDQALMSVLPTKFHTLRLWALMNKILIIDEAHSYDPYMEEELACLLRFHRHFGGSAIVLTATLPTKMKQKLAAAYYVPPESQKFSPTSPYPA